MPGIEVLSPRTPLPTPPTEAAEISPASTTVRGAVAGAGGEPPRRPERVGGPLGHYADDPRRPAAKPRFVNPSVASDAPATRYLALRQTVAARNLLYRPGDNVRTQLSRAASNMKKVMAGLDEADLTTLGTRLLGGDGILAGQGAEDMRAAVARVAEDDRDGAASATDRAVVLALMGDVGALYADTGATTGVEGRTEDAAARLRQNLARHVGRGLGAGSVFWRDGRADSEPIPATPAVSARPEWRRSPPRESGGRGGLPRGLWLPQRGRGYGRCPQLYGAKCPSPALASAARCGRAVWSGGGHEPHVGPLRQFRQAATRTLRESFAPHPIRKVSGSRPSRRSQR